MGLTESFELLGLSPDSEKEEIRKAYLELLPNHHPEDDPNGFVRLRGAYEEAIAFVDYKAAMESEEAVEAEIVSDPPKPAEIKNSYEKALLMAREALDFEEAGNAGAAAEYAEASLSEAPRNIEMWELLGRIYDSAGNITALENVLERAEAAGVSSIGLRLLRASMLSESPNREKEAIDLLEEILLTESTHNEALEKLGTLYAKRGRASAAVELVTQLIERQTDNPYVYLLRGWIFANFPQSTDSFARARARADFHSAIKLMPGYAPGWYQLGCMAYEEGLMEEAAYYFNKTLEISPGFAGVHIKLVLALKKIGKPSDALKILDEGLKRMKDIDKSTYDFLIILREEMLTEVVRD